MSERTYDDEIDEIMRDIDQINMEEQTESELEHITSGSGNLIFTYRLPNGELKQYRYDKSHIFIGG